MKKKLLSVMMHCSTGGMPVYVLKKIELLKDIYDILVVEYDCISDMYVVQRDKIKSIVPLRTLGKTNKMELMDIVTEFNPDIVHVEEIPEMFMDRNVAVKLYNKNRKYTIVETTHDSSFDIRNKVFLPDRFAFVSKYSMEQFKPLGIPMDLIEYPIEFKERPDRTEALKSLGLDPDYLHILNVGLWFFRKNQGECIEYAKKLLDYKVQFHFVGNQAENFESYWGPLMKDLPSNCRIWGERSDVDKFYSSMDLFLFTSIGTANNKETSPIVIKEAIEWDMPIFIYDLDVYMGMYDKEPGVMYLDKDSKENNLNMIKKQLNLDDDLAYSDLMPKELPKSCYVCFCNDVYSPIMDKLIKSIRVYSDMPIVAYSINFDYKKKFDNVYIKRLDFDKPYNIEIGPWMILLKSLVLMDALNSGIEEIVYLDSDMVVRHNIEDLFYNHNICHKYPLVSKSPSYSINYGNGYNPEVKLSEKLGITLNPMHHVNCNVMVVNKTCLDFIKEWSDICKSLIYDYDDAEERRQLCYSGYDEIVMNVLLKKYNYQENLGYVYYNVPNLDSVRFFYDFDYSNYNLDQNGGYMLGNSGFYYVPPDKNSVCCFSGLRDFDVYSNVDKMVDIMDNVIDYVKLNKKDNNMVLNYDDDEKEVSVVKNINDNIFVDIDVMNDVFNENDFGVSFDGNENKVEISYNGNVDVSCKVSIQDIDTKIPIYYFDMSIKPNSVYWAIPIPKWAFSFIDEARFRGFNVDFYDKNDKYVFSKTWEKSSGYSNNNHIFKYNGSPFDCLYVNYHEFFIRGIYDDIDIDDMDIVLDIGANKGLFAYYMRVMRNANKVYAVEAVKSTCDDIKNAFGYDENIICINKGMAGNSGNRTIRVADDNSTISSFYDGVDLNVKHHIENIDVISYDDFIKMYNINHISLLKMDVEGAEYEIFETLTSEHFKNIDKILLEFHSNNNKQLDSILYKLKENGYKWKITKQSSKEEGDKDMLGGLIYAKKDENEALKDNVLILHLLSDLTASREQTSIRDISIVKTLLDCNLKSFVNEPYTSLPPSINCRRPDDVAYEPGYCKLSPGHYGCYLAHKDGISYGIKKHIEKDLDYLLVFECDAVINDIDEKTLINKIKTAYKACIDYDLALFTLGPNIGFPILEKHGDVNIVNGIRETHALIIPKKSYNIFEHIFNDAKWDTIDVLYESELQQYKIGVFEKPIFVQDTGMSLLDKKVKNKGLYL